MTVSAGADTADNGATGRRPSALGANAPPGSSGDKRWSLRTRLIVLVLATAAAALAVVGLALPTVVRSALVASRDEVLTSLMAAVPGGLAAPGIERLSGGGSLHSGLGWTLVYSNGNTKKLVYPVNERQAPALSPAMPVGLSTVAGTDGTGSYRVLATTVLAANGTPARLVVWSNQQDIDHTIDTLVLAELTMSAGLLVLLGTAAFLLIRREMKPLEDMTVVADSIAQGDLGHRVTTEDSGAEVNRLGRAFNGMLDSIAALLAERQAAANRLRQFVADASHELRTPVAAVRGYTDLYSAGALPDDNAVDRAMERMGFESRRMAALVDDLLTLAKADNAGELTAELIDLQDLLRGAVDDARAIDPGRSWQLASAAGPTTVIGDRLRLHQLFANLLGNVRAHTPAGTTATVAITADADPRFVVVDVADNGPGVAPDALPLLFDRFYRVDASRSRELGGSGLGLAIVAAIAAAHGGQVYADAVRPHGLRISVRLPRAA